ncbi:helix-turn-helix domain-containing protein [Prevotella cerevisiae]|uniref:Helix-turn-helix domain-containing protein n=1 Tax=Segatella cerevisiae TaxID=2053716 RepID=A0ABT1BTV2_9BACT|nr:helix-turn-helix domain-containing protein [Segatella cerevisiae]MCO6024518.1 helix-turn-helix domain-containing protein [Segatella cerevisiae]
MNIQEITEINIPLAKSLSQSKACLDDDLILFDRISDIPLPDKPCRLQCLLIALCTKGSLKYSLNTRELQAFTGDIIIIGRGQVINHIQQSRDCIGIAFMISYPFFHQIFTGIHNLSTLFLFSRQHPVLKLEPSEEEDIMNYFYLIRAKIREKVHRFRKDTIRLLLNTMSCDVCNIIYQIQSGDDRQSSRAEAIFTEFMKLVKENYKTAHRVKWYSDHLCMTSKYLSETVKTVSHHTPNEWLNSYIAAEIKIQLKDSSKSIKQIAMDLHFPNQGLMGKYFKGQTGMSPTSYRLSQKLE